MALITNKSVPTFDLTMINRGDGIRFRRATDTTARNGIVTRLTDAIIEILFSNVQNNGTSFIQITAGDVAIGVWEIWWTTDFQTVNYNPAAAIGGDG
jgi:hypothetical protein